MKAKLFFLAVFSLFSLMFASCDKQDEAEDTRPKGHLKIEITDAPADDAKIEGVFVTIADIKVDGISLEGYNKTTIDLLAYQNGRTRTLFSRELEASTFNSITLELDFERDANGNGPGCYVLDENGTKHPLASNLSAISKSHEIQVEAGAFAEVVIDFDLRKAVQWSQSSSSGYTFVPASSLNKAVRVVNKNETGVIRGNVNMQGVNNDMVVVYAYKKGSFNRSAELQGSAESKLKFHNAISSAKVGGAGQYELHFLERGDYEIHFATYNRNLVTGRMELKGSLMVDVLSSFQIGSIPVNASTTTTVNVQATGSLPI